MKLITILVSVSQALRSLAIKARNKAIRSIEKGLKSIEVELKEVEERRSNHMHAAHQEYYRTMAGFDGAYELELNALRAKYEAKRNRNYDAFSEKRKVIALVAKGAVTELTQARVKLSTELDHLTK